MPGGHAGSRLCLDASWADRTIKLEDTNRSDHIQRNAEKANKIRIYDYDVLSPRTASESRLGMHSTSSMKSVNTEVLKIVC